MRPGNASLTKYSRSGNLFLFIAFLLTRIFTPPVIMAQTDTSYSFIVAGHAYGAHDGGNTGLHPAFLESLDKGFDQKVAFFVFTGDVVNQSTEESWQQVDIELAEYGLPYYFAMGNHDDNDAGYKVFEEKFGGTYYSFLYHDELYIVLNSTEEDRSISPVQLEFLENSLETAGDTVENIFIFFHEVLWNSNEKYAGVMSNSRSRYDKMVNYSNYWEDVHPILVSMPEKNFYIITGDVGGNTDAIAAFYDKHDNVCFLSSGMGEVDDENYLLVHVPVDLPVQFDLVPLRENMQLQEIPFYSVPASPDTIYGPLFVPRSTAGVEYTTDEVFNADSYSWTYSQGISGSESGTSILADFDSEFDEGTLSVSALKNGFGKSPQTSLSVKADFTGVELRNADEFFRIIVTANQENTIYLQIFSSPGMEFIAQIYDITGKSVDSRCIRNLSDNTQIQMDGSILKPGAYVLVLSSANNRTSMKFMIK